uniref:Sortilin 1a n=1 Tax=Eptatretus burgeri TaxID=7764 RepID=A0A8C4Q6M6_EPTBU
MAAGTTLVLLLDLVLLLRVVDRSESASAVFQPLRRFRRNSMGVGDESTATTANSSHGPSSEMNVNCSAHPEFVHKLIQNTFLHEFTNDHSTAVTLAWMGENTKVILALTTFSLPLLEWLGRTRLYRSVNYGKTFDDISKLVENAHIMKNIGISVRAGNQSRVVLTSFAYDSSGRSFTYVSKDLGSTFNKNNLPFVLLEAMVFHPTNPDCLMAYTYEHELWITEDLCKTWQKVHTAVFMHKWGPDNLLYLATDPKGKVDRAAMGKLQLKRSRDFGRTFDVVAENVFSFGTGGRFLYASIFHSQNSPRVVKVSLDQGDSWTVAQLPLVEKDQFYSVLMADNSMIFMHVDAEGDAENGTVYASDDRGAIFSKSMEHHYFPSNKRTSDFTKVNSLRGVYLSSQVLQDGNVKTVITYDQGGVWQSLPKPQNVECIGSGECHLHLHGATSMLRHLPVPQTTLSEANAVGIILAHGSVGEVLSSSEPDVYVSDDGGYTWARALRKPHYYAILDSGGVLVAVPKTDYVSSITFSLDEGQCWHPYNLPNGTMRVMGIYSEPGAHSFSIGLWGYLSSGSVNSWVVVTVDFRELLSRPCNDSDYVAWTAHSAGRSGTRAVGAEAVSVQGCMLGLRQQFNRLQKESVCRNGRGYQASAQALSCKCTKRDYICDYGYYRDPDQDDCQEETAMIKRPLHICIYGKEEVLLTQGYRKIPGDGCEGGFTASDSFKLISKSCTYTLLSNQTVTSLPTTPGAVTTEVMAKASGQKPHRLGPHWGLFLAIGIVTLLLVAFTILITRRYCCRPSRITFLYSQLRQADEDPIEDPHARLVPKQTYHDDSDDVS